MKKLFAVLLTALMILTLCACGGELPVDTGVVDTGVADTPAPDDTQTQIPDSGSDPEPSAPAADPQPDTTESAEDPDPVPTDTEPAPTDPDPEPTDTESAPTDTDPEPTDTDPEPTDTEPDSTSSDDPEPTPDPNALAVECDSVTAAAGEEVQVVVKLTANPGFVIARAYCSYDKSVLELTDVDNHVRKFTLTWGASILLDAAGDYDGTGPLLTLTFRVLPDAPAGEYEVRFIVPEIINDALEDVPVQGGAFTVTVE